MLKSCCGYKECFFKGIKDNMYNIKIGDRVIEAQAGAKLSDVFIKEGIAHEHPCGCKGICKKCEISVNGKKELSCKYYVNSDITVELFDNSTILSETGAVCTKNTTSNMCFCLDIGTTTLALALVSIDEKRIIKVITRTNPQRAFGADVISRIEYCGKNSVSPLNSILIKEINSMIEEFGLLDLKMLYVTGNTTMLHLFFNVDCSGLGVAPYKPVFLESKECSANELGLCGVENIFSLPSISAFVGADIVAGLHFVSPPQENKYSLLVDLGTNAEIVLFSQDTVVCTSAAAGPCFEGANISCGMSAVNGAVYAFSMDSDSKKHIKTVDDCIAKGICGTGIIDIIAELLENGIIDKTGYMESDKFHISYGVYITKEDIRQFQLAKSAVCSAILTLIKYKGIDFCDIDKMYISGGFSAEINIQNAVKTGLLPKELCEKSVAINNSSLLGTVKFACENSDLSSIVYMAQYIDLSADKDFSDLFIENMSF